MRCAGSPGALYANHTNYIVPGLMSWQHSGDLMFMVILGGMASTAGPVLGAFAFIFTEEFLKVLLNRIAPIFGKRDWGGVLGRCSWARFSSFRSSSSAAGSPGSSTSPMLEVRGLTKTFGALRACDGIDFEVREGETHAVIGPNGAGKTTFISQLAGNLWPDAGTVRFAGEDITRLPAHRRARKGLARSFQITSVFPDFSALHNVALAVQAQLGRTGFWRPARATPRSSSRRGGSSRSACRAPTCWRRTCRTASTASSRWPWRSPPSRACSCSTSRWPAWASRNRSA